MKDFYGRKIQTGDRCIFSDKYDILKCFSDNKVSLVVGLDVSIKNGSEANV